MRTGIPKRFKDLLGKWITYYNGDLALNVLVKKAEWSDEMWLNEITGQEAYTVKLKVEDIHGNTFYTKPYPSGVYAERRESIKTG